MSQQSQSRKAIKFLQKQNYQRMSNLKNGQGSHNNNSVSTHQQSSDFLKSVYEQSQRQHIQRQARQPTRSKSKRQERQRVFSKGKRNQLSCQHILTIAKKRQTHSALENHASVNNSNKHSQHGLSANSNRNKCKKKKLKKPTIMMAHKNLNHQSWINFDYNIGETSQMINYPLSKSNSFIVFSDRDTTMNNTFLKSKVMSIKKQTQSNRNFRFKPHQAAILIQKTWRGYMTRKLLEQYIIDEEPRLLEALDNYRSLSNSGIRNNQESSLNLRNQISHFQGEKYINNSLGNSLLNSKQINVCDLSSIGQFNVCNMVIKDILDSSKNSTSTIKRNYSNVDQNLQKSNALNSIFKTPKQNIQSEYEDFLQNNRQSKQFDQNQIVLNDCFKRQKLTLCNQNLEFTEYNLLKQIERTMNKSQAKAKQQQQNRLQCVMDGFSQRFNMQISDFQKHDCLKSPTPSYQKQMISHGSNLKISTKSSNDSSPQQTNREKTFQISKAFQICLNSLKDQTSQMQLQSIFKHLQMYFNKVVVQKKLETRNKLGQNQISLQEHIQQSKRIKKIFVFAMQKLEQFKQFSTSFKQAVEGIQKPSQTSLNLQTEENKQNTTIAVREPQKAIRKLNKPATQVFMIDQQRNYMKDEHLEYNNDKKVSQIDEGYENTEQNQGQTQNEQPRNNGLYQLKYYILSITQQIYECSGQISQLQFLCQLLRKHTETGPENMIQRCLIQFLVELITGQYQLGDVLKIINQMIEAVNGQSAADINCKEQVNIIVENQSALKQQNKRQQIEGVIEKWAKQLNKWNLDVIEEVSHFMESSSFLTQGNDKTLDKDTLKLRLNFLKE